MRKAVFLSMTFHVAIMLLAMFGVPWSFREPPILDEPVVLVELAPIAERTNAPPPAAPPRPEPPKPEPPKPEPPKPEPPKPEPPKPEPPKPEPPKPEPAPRAEPAPKKAEPPPPEPIAKPRPKPEPPKPAFDPNKLAALLDRAPRTPSSAPQPAAPPQPAPQSAARPVPNAPSSPLAPVTQGERDFLVAQIQRNWNLDCGRKDADKIVVRVQAHYNPDGSLRDQPQILDQGQLFAPGRESWAAAAQAALRAVLMTQPLKFPPGDLARWNQPFILNFDSRAFCGG
ncbi:MAG: energy transducer TonB [Alphaproteobacteria bacterium]|nr:energy transducer TonB [Alphaproteobacteria bacterium]